jgi:hypothetical protein
MHDASCFTMAFCAVSVQCPAMREILATNDLVLLSYAAHLLGEAGIEFEVFDTHMSAVEGSIGAIPRRLMVASDDFAAAKRTLGNASITISS